jgi:hypothetical protein
MGGGYLHIVRECQTQGLRTGIAEEKRRLSGGSFGGAVTGQLGKEFWRAKRGGLIF